MAVVRFDQVSVTFGRGRTRLPAVRDVSVEVGGHESLGLVGESGSGKSTLAKAAVGLVEPSSGAIYLDDQRVSHAHGHAAQERRRMQMIFQDPQSCLNPRRTIGASLDEALVSARIRKRGKRLSHRDTRSRIAELLDMVALPESVAERVPQQLSGGQRQRIGIVRAVAAEPDVILADEITSSLDVSVQGTVLNILRDLQRELQFGMLFISHNLAVVRLVCDRIAVMQSGRLVEEGAVTDVLESPSEQYTEQLIAAIPSF